MDAKDSKDPVQTAIELEYEKRSRKIGIVVVVTSLLLLLASYVFRILPDIDLWWELAVVATILIGAGRLVYLIKKGRDLDAKDSKDPVQTAIELEVERRIGKFLIVVIAFIVTVMLLGSAPFVLSYFLLDASWLWYVWLVYPVVIVLLIVAGWLGYLIQKGCL